MPMWVSWLIMGFIIAGTLLAFGNWFYQLKKMKDKRRKYRDQLEEKGYAVLDEEDSK